MDATGNIVAAGGDLVGSFNGALELVNKLAQSQDVSDCFASQWFRFSMGRMESVDDSCSMQDIQDAFHASGGNIRDLLARIAVSPSFRNVRYARRLIVHPPGDPLSCNVDCDSTCLVVG